MTLRNWRDALGASGNGDRAMDLFDTEEPAEERRKPADATQPLAARMRPQSLEDVVGQDHILGPGKLLRRAIEADRLGSVILYGPPGCGKTTLAEVIARATRRRFERTSGVLANVAILRTHLESAKNRRKTSGAETILFIDEIHRWNKSQQDALLPHVEAGTVLLIGATTENPSFEVVSALLSRASVYRLHELGEQELKSILGSAMTDTERGLGGYKLKLDSEAENLLLAISAGDARTLLNTLELAALSKPRGGKITRTLLEDVVGRKSARYDKSGEDHYNVISAFIKSMRGSDADAAIYYLARMIDAGEDPRFIARRMVVFASEDIGNADPHALLVAVAAFDAVSYIGLPECRINLAQAVTYLASAPKSNASYRAIDSALAEVRTSGALPVPLHLRNASTKLMKNEGYGRGYEYAHTAKGGVVSHGHLPEKLLGRRFYEPTEAGLEAKIKASQAKHNNKREKNQ